MKVMLESQTPSATHTTHLTLAGFSPGSYAVSVDGASVGSVTVASGTSSVVSLTLGTDAAYTVEIGRMCRPRYRVRHAGSDCSGASSDVSAGSKRLQPRVAAARVPVAARAGGSSSDAGPVPRLVQRRERAQSGRGDGPEGSSGSSSGAAAHRGRATLAKSKTRGTWTLDNSAAGCGCTAVGQSSTTSSAAGIMSLVGLLLEF